jgi:DNA-binding CsgD family transcriptional regulator
MEAREHNGAGTTVLVETLSPREREILHLVSGGSTNSEIAASLGVSVHAVKFHLASVYRKLGVANRTEAAVAFLSAAEAFPVPREDGLG